MSARSIVSPVSQATKQARQLAKHVIWKKNANQMEAYITGLDLSDQAITRALLLEMAQALSKLTRRVDELR